MKKNFTEQKLTPLNIGKRNALIKSVFNLISLKKRFLLLGHTLADEDCIASLSAFALLIKKFQKDVFIYLAEPVSEKLSFLFDICSYNGIKVFFSGVTLPKVFDAVFILDTPKPEMIAAPRFVQNLLKNSAVPKIEIDHHIGTDAAHTGDSGWNLTVRASSTCEIIARMCEKLNRMPNLLEKHGIKELYSRNIILAILTGMLGDAKLGNYLFKRRDKAFFDYFLNKFNTMLHEKFYKGSKNISSIEEILDVFDELSSLDTQVYAKILSKAYYTDKIGALFLDEKESHALEKNIEHSRFVELIKKATDQIAETACGIGISAYFDPPYISDKIQFRLRASQAARGADLRPVLTELRAEDGGGHPGAVGFRFPASKIADLPAFVQKIIKITEMRLQ